MKDQVSMWHRTVKAECAPGLGCREQGEVAGVQENDNFFFRVTGVSRERKNVLNMD